MEPTTDDGLRGDEGKSKGGDERERNLFEIRAGAQGPHPIWSLGARLAKVAADGVSWVLTHFTSPTVMSAVIGLAAYAWFNRDAVRVLPFEGNPNGAALALQLTQMLDAVDKGARAGIDEELDGFKTTATKPPDVTIPGTGVSLTALVDWGQTHVQGQLVDEAKNTLHRVRLEVTGRNVSEQVETEAKTTVDEAMMEGAERLYAVLRPVNAAYYYFSRYPDRGLEVLQRSLDGDHPSLSVYRVWGLALRNLGDFDGALDAFHRADAQATTPAEHAHLLVEMGYTAKAAKRWPAAVDYFDEASGKDPTWPVPIVRRADALRESGDLQGALGAYERGGTIKPSFADAWVGVGRVHAAEGRGDLAIVAYETARRFAFDKRQRASLLRDIGDVLFGLGCYDEAARRYTEAMSLASTYDIGPATPKGRACPSGSPPGRGEAPGCVAYEPVPTAS